MTSQGERQKTDTLVALLNGIINRNMDAASSHTSNTSIHITIHKKEGLFVLRNSTPQPPPPHA